MNFNRLLLKTVGLTLVVFLLDGCGAQIQPTATTPLPTATSVPPTTTSSTAPAVTVLPISSPQPVGDGVVDGWAVLAEKDDYDDVAMVNLPIDYIDITRISQLLLDSGWQKSRIRELREFDLEDMRQALAWLTENADADDIVLFYVSAHESYLHRVWWVGFFADNWAAVPSHQRVLLVEASAKFTSAVDGDERPYLSIATVDENETHWVGLEEEGLPIIGSVFTYYFVAAFADLEADLDKNGAVSVQEAALYAEGQQRTYIHEVVFAVPEFLAMYHGHPEDDAEYPHVVVDDTMGEPIYFELALP